MLGLGVLTDEIGQDLEHALVVMEELGLKYVELQSLWDKDVTKLTRDELKKVKAIISDRGMKVSCVAARMFFNLPLRAGPEETCYWGSYSEHLDDLRRAIEIAKELGTGIVRTFSFKNETLLEPSALQVGAKRLDDIARQRAHVAFLSQLDELLEVVVNDSTQKRVLRLARCVGPDILVRPRGDDGWCGRFGRGRGRCR